MSDDEWREAERRMAENRLIRAQWATENRSDE